MTWDVLYLTFFLIASAINFDILLFIYFCVSCDIFNPHSDFNFNINVF
jgi:hypothetical protein